MELCSIGIAHRRLYEDTKEKKIFSGTFSFQISFSVLGCATNSAVAAAPTQLLQGWQNLQPVVLAAAAQTALKITARLTLSMYIRAQNLRVDGRLTRLKGRRTQ